MDMGHWLVVVKWQWGHHHLETKSIPIDDVFFFFLYFFFSQFFLMCLFEHWHSFGSCIVVVYTFFFWPLPPNLT